MNKLEHYHEVINQKQLIIFHVMFLYMTCNIHCEEILSLEIVDFIKTFYFIFQMERCWGDLWKLSADDPECIYYANFANWWMAQHWKLCHFSVVRNLWILRLFGYADSWKYWCGKYSIYKKIVWNALDIYWYISESLINCIPHDFYESLHLAATLDLLCIDANNHLHQEEKL